MSKRLSNAVLCCTALMFGGALYVLFRQTTYVAGLFNSITFIGKLCDYFSEFSCDFIRFYLPDFLWGFALCCGLLSIFSPSKTTLTGCAITTFLCGCTWEILQYYSIISGTGDLKDITMYLLAVILAVIINLKGLLS